MTATEAFTDRVMQAWDELRRAQEAFMAVCRQAPRDRIGSYVFQGPNGTTATVEDLFGGRDELIVVHNMGKSCVYCTTYADGFNGVLPHLRNRAAFALISPDDPATQQAFAHERGWRMPMWSSAGTTFRADMGFQDGDSLMPGVSIFRRLPDGGVEHAARSFFDPGDPFCVAFNLFELLDDGFTHWEPRFTYSE